MGYIRGKAASVLLIALRVCHMAGNERERASVSLDTGSPSSGGGPWDNLLRLAPRRKVQLSREESRPNFR